MALGVPVVSHWVKNPTNIHEDADLIPGLSGLRIRCSCKLWHRFQMRLGSGVAVAVA